MNRVKGLVSLGADGAWQVNDWAVRFAVLSFFMAFGTIAAAFPIEDIDVGDTFYINNLFSENELVVVKRIDREGGRVKIQYLKGGVEWVAPSKLLTRTSSRTADVEEDISGTALIAGVIWAILAPDSFDRAMSSEKPSDSKSRRNTQNQDSATTTTVAITATIQ